MSSRHIVNLLMPDEDANGSESKGSEDVASELVVARCDSSKMLALVD
jgi:hypothetical protein